MVPLVYFFGNLGNGLTQYPGDYSAAIFKEIVNQDENEEQIIVYRNGNLLYYCYLRRFSEGHRTLGICIAYDKVCRRMDSLFAIFSTMFEDLVEKGIVLRINDKGKLIIDTTDLVSEMNELDARCRILADKFLKIGFEVLPPVNLSISNVLVARHSLEDNQNELLFSLSQYSHVYITRKDKELHRVTAVSSLIDAKNKEIESLTSQYSKLKAKQKNLTWVIVLAILLLACVSVAYFIGDSLNRDLNETMQQLSDTTYYLNSTRKQLSDTSLYLGLTRDRLRESQTLVREQSWTIDSLSTRNALIIDSVDSLMTRYHKQEFDILREDKPFHILNSTFYWSRGELYVNYYSSVDKWVELYTNVLLSRNDSLINSYYTRVYIYQGTNNFTLNLSRQLDSGKYYKFLFFVDDKFIGGVRH
jgi:hypothetical protein